MFKIIKNILSRRIQIRITHSPSIQMCYKLLRIIQKNPVCIFRQLGLKYFFSLSLVLVSLVSCSTKSIVPNADKLTISRDKPPEICKNLGRVQGRTIGTSPNIEAAIEDMKKDAAFKGANYVVMETASGYETAVSGTAYYCP